MSRINLLSQVEHESLITSGLGIDSVSQESVQSNKSPGPGLSEPLLIAMLKVPKLHVLALIIFFFRLTVLKACLNI